MSGCLSVSPGAGVPCAGAHAPGGWHESADGSLRWREPRPGDEIRWVWTGERPDGKWFRARLLEKSPAGFPGGWSAEITDPGTVYAPQEWDRPVGYQVFVDEPSMTVVKYAEVSDDQG